MGSFTTITWILILAVIVLLAGLVILALLRQKAVKDHRRLVVENEALIDELDRVKKRIAYQRKRLESRTAEVGFLCNMSHEIRTPLHAIMGFWG
jgi:signal transduction histidine kinase